MKLVDLYNPNRFTVPILIKNGEELMQVKINSKEHLKITKDQVTDSVNFLTDPSRGQMLVETEVDA